MLQDIRQNIQGTMAKIIIGLIVISFSIFGIESILLGGGNNEVAEVNGEPISPVELQQAVNTQKRQLIAMMGDNLDPAMLDDQMLAAQALESIINRKLLTQGAQELDLAVSETQLGSVIGGMEQFQINGQFSPEAYKSLLANAGFTPASFKAGLAQDLLINQARSGLAGSDFATPAELELNASFTDERRDVRYLTIPVQAFRAELDVTDQDIEAYYAQHQNSFMTAEAVELDYIELTPEQFTQPVEESVVLEQYELEKENYQYLTENRVSHILFETRAEESVEQRDARVAEAQARLAAGEEFAEVARSASDDIGSASAGGDLGFSEGDAFPEEMEEAIATLAVGQVSEPVETDAGLHLIKLDGQRAGSMPSIEELRPELERRVQLQEARRELALSVESLKDLAFNAEDLTGPAQELDMTIASSDVVLRNQSEGLFANASLLAAAFSPDVLEEGHNSDVVELSGDHYVVLRVREHHKPEVKPLAEVRVGIIDSIKGDAARAAVAAEAQRALAALRAGTGVEAFATENGYEWQVELSTGRRNALMPPQILDRAFALAQPASGESVFDYVIAPTGDAQVLELASVAAGDYVAMAPEEKLRLQRQLRSEQGQMVDVLYQRALRDRADISTL